MNIRVHDRSAGLAECNVLLNSRVRIKAKPELTGFIATVMPDKLGKPYQVHVKLDGAPNAAPMIYSPDEVEPEFLV